MRAFRLERGGLGVGAALDLLFDEPIGDPFNPRQPHDAGGGPRRLNQQDIAGGLHQVIFGQ